MKDKTEGGDLHTHLRLRKKRKKSYGSQNRRGMIPNRVSIDQRPTVVEKRSRIGDWEIDTIIGSHHCGVFVTLVESKSRLCLIAWLPNKLCSRGETIRHRLAGPFENKGPHTDFR